MGKGEIAAEEGGIEPHGAKHPLAYLRRGGQEIMAS